METSSIHQFKMTGIKGETINFADFAGKKLIVVNVASKCGYTPQYQQLEELYRNFSDRLVIVGFPSNDFGAQEPGSNDEIYRFCELNYSISFPLTTKVSIKEGSIHPIYEWLTDKSLNQHMDSSVNWNFHKFLLNEQGNIVKSLPSSVTPFDDPIMSWLL